MRTHHRLRKVVQINQANARRLLPRSVRALAPKIVLCTSCVMQHWCAAKREARKQDAHSEHVVLHSRLYHRERASETTQPHLSLGMLQVAGGKSAVRNKPVLCAKKNDKRRVLLEHNGVQVGEAQ